MLILDPKFEFNVISSSNEELFLSPSTRVKNIFITLSNIEQNNPSLIILDVKIKIINIFPTNSKTDFVIVKESHLINESHYHILIKNSEGISKNTYRLKIRNIFPEFKGIIIDIKGIKQDNGIIKYILKNVPTQNILNILNSLCSREPIQNLKLDESIIFRNPIFLLKILQKDNKFTDIITIHSIIKYSNIEVWYKSSLNNTLHYTKNPRKILNLWEISRSYIPYKEYLTEYYKITLEKVTHSAFFLECNSLSVPAISYKYNISYSHLFILIHITHAILIRENIFPIFTKITNLTIKGPANSGKTSLFRKFSEIFRKDIFYFIGNRANDFSNYKNNNKPIIVWDDVFFTTSSFQNHEEVNITKLNGWNLRILLKIFAHEETLVDIKYKQPVCISPTINFIITNHVELFEDKYYNNIKKRLKIIYIDHYDDIIWKDVKNNKKEIIILLDYNNISKCDYIYKYKRNNLFYCDWINIRKIEFIKLIFFSIKLLINIKSDIRLFNNLNYSNEEDGNKNRLFIKDW